MAKADIVVDVFLNGAALQQVEEGIREGLEDGLLEDVLPAAVEGSPVATGHNRRSLDVEVSPAGQRVEGVLFGTSGYSGWLEVGTSRMPARPYMVPAVERHRESILRRIAQKVGALR